MIDVSGADAYLTEKNHLRGRTWKRTGADQKSACVAHAKRLIERIVGDDFEDATTTSDDWPRWDLAVYEQAIDMAANSDAVQNGDVASEKVVATRVSKNKAPKRYDSNRLCQSAMFWIVKSTSTVRLSRG